MFIETPKIAFFVHFKKEVSLFVQRMRITRKFSVSSIGTEIAFVSTSTTFVLWR